MDICTILNDTYRMLLANASSIEQSAAHVLQSVLHILPTNSLLSRSYAKPLDCHAICIKGHESNQSSCLMTLREHQNSVTTVVSSPDGGLLASASLDKTIKLWDPHTGEHLRTLEGHSSEVNSVAFSLDGGLLASVSSDKTIKLWDPHTGEHLRTLEGHSSFVMSVGFSPDGGLLASASLDKTIKLWDPHTGEHLRTLDGHSSEVTTVVFTSVGHLLASASRDKTIKLWDPHTGEHLRTLEGHSSGVVSVAFPPDGGPLTSVSDNNTITPRDLHTTKHLPKGPPLHVHSTSHLHMSLVHDAHTGKLVHSDAEFSLPQINGGQYSVLLKKNWVCAGPAYIFCLPSAFEISTWKHKGSFVCFGSRSGKVLILDISPAISTLGRM